MKNYCDKHWKKRYRAIREMSKTKTISIEFLIDSLLDRNQWVRKTAKRLFLKPHHISQIFNQLVHNEDAYMKIRAACVLCNMGTLEITDRLLSLLKHKNKKIRNAVSYYLPDFNLSTKQVAYLISIRRMYPCPVIINFLYRLKIPLLTASVYLASKGNNNGIERYGCHFKSMIIHNPHSFTAEDFHLLISHWKNVPDNIRSSLKMIYHQVEDDLFLPPWPFP